MSQTSISALREATNRHNAVANNVAHVGTTGYKAQKVHFSSMVSGTSLSGVTPAGVRSTNFADPNQQGALQNTGRPLDFGIAGKGLMVYGKPKGDAAPAEFAYGRAGQIIIDKKGNLVNGSSGYQLMGYATDAQGVPRSQSTSTLKNLSPINVNNAHPLARPQPSTAVQGKLNLPREAADGETKQNTVIVYDSLGKAHDLVFTWTKAAGAPQWGLAVTCVDGTVEQAAATPYTALPVIFDENGDPASFNGGEAFPNVLVTWNNGAAASTISLDLGTVGESNGATSIADDFDVNLTSDGKIAGKFNDISIDEYGNVVASFTSGESIPFAKIALINFPASHQLDLINDNLYIDNADTGSYILGFANSSGLGTIHSGSLEQSDVDLATELTSMMENQRFYQSNTSVLKGYDDMYQALSRLQK